MLTPLALALERSIIVIGDPFNPGVDRISPNIGQEGETVTVSGRNFGFPLEEFEVDPNEDITVSFCQVSMSTTDPANAPFANVLVAEIERRTNTQIVITVPDDFEETFDTGTNAREVYVCIDKDINLPRQQYHHCRHRCRLRRV